ncbi:hypothetical protein D4Q80_03620 [bacterium]|nr:MAG: hypothetical protein D4Q80_03620 [bacterium]
MAEGLGIAIPQGIEDVTDVTDTRLQAFNQAIYRAQVAQVLINESQPSVDNQALITKLNTCSIQDIAATAAPGLFEARKADVTERRRQMTDDGIKESVARLITWVPDDGDAQSRNVVQNRLADLDAVAGNLYHPQSMVLDRTLVDNYGRSISTAYYGMDYVPAWPVAIGPPAPGRFTPVKLDKVTNYYWGSYGQAVSLTTDYSDIRVPDVWPTKTITRLVPGENVLDTGLLIREQRYAFHGPSDADHALDNRLSTWGDAIAKYAEEGKYEPKSIEELKVLVRQLRERVPDIDEKVNHFWRTHGRPNYRGGLGDNTNWAHILAVLAQPGVAEQLYSGVKTRHDNMWDYLFWATSQTEPFLTSSHVEQPWISQNNVNRLLMPAGSGQAISVDPTWHPGKGTDVTAVAPILFPIVNTSREETKTTPQSITLGPNITATLNVYETGPGASPYTGPSRIINAYRYNSGSALQPFYAAPRHIVSAKANDLERQYVDSRLQTEHSDKLAEYQGKKTDAEREKYWNDQIVPLIDGKDGNPGLLAQFRADTFVMPANIPTDKQDAWNSIKSQWEALRPQREITNNADGTRTVTYEKADKHAYDYASSPLKSAEGVSVSEMHRIDRRDVPIALWSLGTGMDIEGQRISPHLQNYTHNPQEVAKIITTEYNTALTDGYRDKLKMVKGFLFNRGGDEIQTVIEDQDNSPNYEVLYSESRQIPGPQEFRVLFPDGLFEGADGFDVGADPIPGLERPRRVNRFLFWREGFTDIGKLHSYISEPKPAPKESLSVPPVPEMPESPVPAEGELAPNLKFKGNDNQLYILVPHKKGFYTVDGKRVDSVKGLGLKRVLSTDEKNKIDIEKQVPARLKITPEMIHSAAETTQHK